MEIKNNNPDVYRKEISKRYRIIKRDLLRRDDIDIAHFLHPNAQKLIEDLVTFGVKTIILDECHHLLDYWSIVLRHLIRRIEGVVVVGLTATLPNPQSEDAYENYTSILGDVDFEVPTPAVVKEGDLAPYRDLVYFVEPTNRELDYLENIEEIFETTAYDLTRNQKFIDWIIKSIMDPYQSEEMNSWENFIYKKPIFSLAGLRFLRMIKFKFPKGMLLPQEAENPLTLDDWATLLERYGLDFLVVSPDPQDQEMFKILKRVLQPFGMTLTERGIRQSRSPGDLLLTFSEAKDEAVAKILSAESEAMNNNLRAVVVTDFEKMSSGVSRLKGVLDRDAGSALRVFQFLAAHPKTSHLEPILVTGKTLLLDSDHGEELVARFNDYLKKNNLKATCKYKDINQEHIFEVSGEGRDWSPRTYVKMVTEVFEEGVTKCLVGTRGIFGEGWDSLSLNTLVDLTSVTTSTSVQQLRGRSIRLDPKWKRKAAHNWDVICIARDYKKGDHDLKRFIRRHRQYWGVIIKSNIEKMKEISDPAHWMLMGVDLENALSIQTDFSGEVAKGIMHVNPSLASNIFIYGVKNFNYKKYNRYMINQVFNREKVFEQWGIGNDYSNFNYSATQLNAKDMKFKTVFTVNETLKRMIMKFRTSILYGLMMTIVNALQFWGENVYKFSDLISGTGVFLLFVLGGFIFVFLLNFREAYRIGKAILVEQPSDAILLDIGKALLESLKETGFVSLNLQKEYVRVVEQPDGSYRVLLDYASPNDSAVFSK
ncbi:MAG: hypothetical protein OEY93_11840, partial [Anaerolineae bacterium]|nr:hypothetical protein [Anaerolineae bacterium]